MLTDSASSVANLLDFFRATSPSGYQPYEKGCVRRDLIQAIPFCNNPEFQLFQRGPEAECVQLMERDPLFSCHEGILEDGLCITRTQEEPAVSCSLGFDLVTQVRRTSERSRRKADYTERKEYLIHRLTRRAEDCPALGCASTAGMVPFMSPSEVRVRAKNSTGVSVEFSFSPRLIPGMTYCCPRDTACLRSGVCTAAATRHVSYHTACWGNQRRESVSSFADCLTPSGSAPIALRASGFCRP